MSQTRAELVEQVAMQICERVYRACGSNARAMVGAAMLHYRETAEQVVTLCEQHAAAKADEAKRAEGGGLFQEGKGA